MNLNFVFAQYLSHLKQLEYLNHYLGIAAANKNGMLYVNGKYYIRILI